MIAYLRGRIKLRGEGWVILEIQGIGYLIYCSNYTLARLPGLEKIALLHVETTELRDFYGFIEPIEKEYFRLLTTVRGVSAKVALRILSTLTTKQLARALIEQDKNTLTCPSGVGPKLATRLTNELKDKVVQFIFSYKELPTASRNISDAISALVNLGYSNTEAVNLVVQAKSILHKIESQTQNEDDADVSVLVRTALKCRIEH